MKDLEKNSIQFDYFSINYKNFEETFYEFSNVNVPLIFLTEDLLLHMFATGHSYFLLKAINSADERDHYFIFKKVTSSENNFVSQFEYLGQVSPLCFKAIFYKRKWVFSLGWFFIFLFLFLIYSLFFKNPLQKIHKKRSYIKWYSLFIYF